MAMSHRTIVLLTLFLSLLVQSSISQPHNTMQPRRPNYCHTISANPPPPAIPFGRLQIVHNCFPRKPPPTPPADLYDGGEIDPRYGVEKRLVPSGPNPLHN
ncbi:hypothetical protein CASFOL_024199 [Castilleja foliolosa]|uniref:Uncharacterized protein n=1 Tax=Castilleja foliolosa TaxID=1961234 RepID=A0ABD3CML6_9LAMI